MSKNVFSAIIAGNAKDLAQLISDKKNIDIVDIMGRTPLMEAVIQGNVDMCRLLLDAGANVNAKDMKQWTALHFAAQEYSYDTVKLLIEKGAVIDAEDIEGNTPLFRSLFNFNGKGDVITLFIKQGADKNHVNKHGVSPYLLAKQVTNFDLKKFF